MTNEEWRKPVSEMKDKSDITDSIRDDEGEIGLSVEAAEKLFAFRNPWSRMIRTKEGGDGLGRFDWVFGVNGVTIGKIIERWDDNPESVSTQRLIANGLIHHAINMYFMLFCNDKGGHPASWLDAREDGEFIAKLNDEIATYCRRKRIEQTKAKDRADGSEGEES